MLVLADAKTIDHVAKTLEALGDRLDPVIERDKYHIFENLSAELTESETRDVETRGVVHVRCRHQGAFQIVTPGVVRTGNAFDVAATFHQA